MSQMPVRILLVEDDEDDVVLTRHVLREIHTDGYDVEWISEYDEALDRLSKAGFDVCLVDYQLGGRDGVQFIQEAIERGVGAPMILLTGQGDRAVDMAAMNAGAADFLSKAQLTSSQLERSIRYSIQQKKAEQQRVRLLMEQAARAEAVAENRAKDEFLAVLSHELRTPLTAVLLSASMLAGDETTDANARELLSIIQRNVELEARLIDDLLDLTRITRGKLELRREVVDLHEQIEYAVRVCCAADIREKQLTARVIRKAEHFHISGDATRLQQVLWNLLKNAVKFTPAGGVIEVVTGDLAPGAGAGEGEWRIFVEVRDTGIGIRPEALPKIFNAFEQADRSITRRFGGLGLGLAICRALVQLHGGTISADSAGYGKGAVFRLEFPITESAPTRAEAGEPHPSDSQRGAISILLVEDHRDTARVMQRLLRSRGYTVHTASSVADAIAVAGQETIHLLISDIGLPDGSGLELIQKLSATAPIRGIALSGFGMEEDIERSHAAGFSEHLTKPVNMAQLEAAIDRTVQSAQLTR